MKRNILTEWLYDVCTGLACLLLIVMLVILFGWIVSGGAI